ncbi:nitrogen regulatory protein P-II-like protein [Leptospira interrogans serovar Grippotyphosa str. LT2186]|uniref:Nitrogen regulatory protein P-II-like protein n=2 Tax=Leptospira interrogans TaxID=173 RepID=M3H8Y4_LEPIR|nr:nitrogen regulatory protein P-II-like protein [Leptospira interrogans serovar Grippotyphosa str. LT2186]EMM98171.1 nitrogen regulatory protein P-II-like protein [Leptospira interrogans serovar Zanoni str. LT2156]
MKLIVAIIQPHKLEEVKSELTKNEIYRLTVSDVQGYGQQKGKRKFSEVTNTK